MSPQNPESPPESPSSSSDENRRVQFDEDWAATLLGLTLLVLLLAGVIAPSWVP